MEEKLTPRREEATDNTITFNLNDIYFEDERVYPEYTEVEAEEIIIPTEEALQKKDEDPKALSEDEIPAYPAKKGKKKRNIFKRLFLWIINLIFLTGDNTIALFKWIFGKLGPFMLFPFKFIFRLIIGSLKDFLSYIKNRPASLSKQIKETALKKAQQKSKEGKTKKPSYIKAFFSYIFSEKRLVRSIVNLAFPIVIFLAVYTVYQANNTSVFALEVIYNGQSLGYIENKDVFEQGKSEALSLIYASDENADSNKSLAAEPVYKIARVAVNELSNPAMISENIIASSDTDYVRACGIYIDGEFLCAVKNESDAITVFEYLLEPYKKEVEASATVAFVEEIEYVTGLYPENSELIWDSYALRSMLSKPKEEAVYHTFTEGDTVKSVRTKYGLTYSELAALNPDVDLQAPETITTLLVSKQVNYVRVKVMRTNVRTETIPFETVEKNSSSLAKGTKKTSQEGVNGKKEVTELVTYIDGVASYSTVISEKTLKKPVNKVVLIGTSTYSGGSSSYGWTWPTRGAYSISSGYGYRSASISGWSYHGGIDIVIGGKSSSGIPVVAAASGTVEKVQKSYSGYGHMVLINHGNGIKTRYAHMQPGSLTVYVGQKVSKGQQIGRIGSTGNSTGPHLHFEVIVNGSKTDPLKYVSR